VRDYKPRRKAKPTNIGNTLLGIFFGLLLGLIMAAAIAIYMMKSPLPWSGKGRAAAGAERQGEAAGEPAGRSSGADKAGSGDRARFDFYRILPGKEGTPAPAAAAPAGRIGVAAPPPASQAPVTAPYPPASQVPERVATAESGAPARDSFILQAGAFQNPAEADNLKAKLALLGMESNIETVALPDKGTWYRVRLGPFRSLPEVTRVRAQLAQSGIDVALVRNNSAP
jgi:cell division protein FtsN